MELHGLQLAQEHNGKIGVVTAKMAKNGRFPVSLVVMHGTTKEEAKSISVKPENLQRVATLEFILFTSQCSRRRNNGDDERSQGGEGLRLSFEWMERISEEKPWYFVFDPPEALWRQPFTADKKMEDRKTYRAEQVEECLQHENEELVAEKLMEIRDHTIKSLQLLTRHGSMDGMQEARRLLLTHPLAMVVLVMKKLISGGYDEELHLLHAAMVSYFEIWKQTNGFRVVEFGPTEQTVFALAGISDLARLREWTLAWWAEVVDRFCALKEFHAIILLFQEWVGVVKGDYLSESEQVLIRPSSNSFKAACHDLGDFESYNIGTGGYYDIKDCSQGMSNSALVRGRA